MQQFGRRLIRQAARAAPGRIDLLNAQQALHQVVRFAAEFRSLLGAEKALKNDVSIFLVAFDLFLGQSKPLCHCFVHGRSPYVIALDLSPATF